MATPTMQHRHRYLHWASAIAFQNIKDMNKRIFYKWHRILGLTGLVPIIFWALSGLSHPFMSNWFRPFIAMETFTPVSQSKMQPALSIQQVMDKNQLATLRNFSLVSFNKNVYYQVLGKDSVYN